MADPFSILAGAVGVTDVAVKASMKLGNLISDFKDAPILVIALSNEVTEIRVVLDRVQESRQGVQSLHDSQHDAFLAALNDQLTKAQTILGELDSLATILSTGNSPTKRFAWLRKKKHATNLKARLKAVRERINELLVAHNPSLGSRIQLELHEVHIGLNQVQTYAQTAIQTANTNFRVTNTDLVTIRNSMIQQHTKVNSEMQMVRDAVSANTAEASSHKNQVNCQFSTIQSTLHTSSHALSHIQSEQIRKFEAIQALQLASLNELAILNSTRVATRQPGPTIQPVPSHKSSNAVVSFAIQLLGSHCADDCGCRCHLPVRPDMSLRIPPFLRAAAGYLFLGYAGYPSSSARCDVQSCARGKYARLQASYRFPLWLCMRYVMHAYLEASTSGILKFTLVARRRMPWKRGHILYEAQYGTAETVAQILRRERGCLQDVTMTDGRSALSFSLSNRNPDRIEISRLLIQYGADPDQEDDSGMSFRMEAAEKLTLPYTTSKRLRELNDLLTLQSIDVLDLSYIHKVVLGISPISVSQALRSPASHLLNAKSRTGLTPLMYAARCGNLAAVRDLIHAGAEVNELDIQGLSALHWVINPGENSLACLDALLQVGAAYNASERYKTSPLHHAARDDSVSLGYRLIDAGADIQLQNSYGETPMYRAARHNAVGMIRLLHDAGASLDSANYVGRTPLIVAIWEDKKEAAVLLLSLGANTTCVGKDKWTLLHYVARYSSLGTMRALTDLGVRGQDLAARTQSGRTAQRLLKYRKPDSEMREAFERLAQAWCRPKEADGDQSDEEDCFHDAVESLDTL